jgi:hypothetical protein
MDLAGQPSNVWSRSSKEIGRLMSNFAPTPFTPDSVEAFYACLLARDSETETAILRVRGPRYFNAFSKKPVARASCI